MKIKKIIPVFLILIALASSLSATSINIDMKESFGLGEKISFDYTIVSETSQEIEYIVSVDCPNAPLPLLDLKTASLEPNIPLTNNYVYMDAVNERIEPQTCKAIVGILNPEISEEKSFSITTNPGFEFNILTCKDAECTEQEKVFVLNENIYLDYISEVSNPLITAILTYPDSSTNQFVFPTSIKAEQTGIYTLEVTASKQGYKTITKKIKFGVIEEEANISYTTVIQKAKDKGSLGAYMFFVIICVLLILIVFLSIRFFGILKKRRRNRQLTKKKLGLQKELKKEFMKKEKIIEKKERKLFRRLFRRKEKLPIGKKQELNKKIKQEKKDLGREKADVKKEFSERLRKEEEMLEEKERKKISKEKLKEIRKLLSKGRRQLSRKNKEGAANTYRKIRSLYGSLKPDEKSRDLYNQILIFHGRLDKAEKR